MKGQLNELEPHPAAEGARQWLIGYIQRNDAYVLLRLQESFASCAIEGNRLAEICSETLRRVLNKEPVSDRYLLGLVWTIRDMEEKEREESRQILLPQNADEARTMALLGTNWLEQNAPEYLRSSSPTRAKVMVEVNGPTRSGGEDKSHGSGREVENMVANRMGITVSDLPLLRQLADAGLMWATESGPCGGNSFGEAVQLVIDGKVPDGVFPYVKKLDSNMNAEDYGEARCICNLHNRLVLEAYRLGLSDTTRSTAMQVVGA